MKQKVKSLFFLFFFVINDVIINLGLTFNTNFTLWHEHVCKYERDEYDTYLFHNAYVFLKFELLILELPVKKI